MRIFLSYSHKDKGTVLPVANHLIKIHGKDSVIIDEYNLKPGDSLIDFMNESLKNFTHFLFFLSNNSLRSYFTSLEWQNALILCADGKKKFVPIIVDSVDVPPIIGNIIRINMYEIGLKETFSLLDKTFSDSVYFESNQPNLFSKISLPSDP